MKILHIISSLNPNLGGPSKGLIDIANGYIKDGHELTICCFDKSEDNFIKNSNLDIVCFSNSIKIKSLFNLYLWIIKNGNKYNSVFINGIWQKFAIPIMYSLTKLKIPYYIFPHGMLDPAFRKIYPIKHIKKLIYWKLFEHKFVSSSAGLIFTCQEEMLLARKNFKPYKTKEFVIPYGISNPPINSTELSQQFLQKYPILKNKNIILFLSRINDKKGLDLLVQAFLQIRLKYDDLHLLIAGPDNDNLQSKIIKKYIKEIDSKSITWAGMLQGEDKWGAFYSATVYCLPSHQENFGIAIVEALSCGVPVVISDKVNIYREIESAGAGFIGNDDVDETRQSLIKFFSCSTIEISKMKASALKLYAESFNIDNTIKKLALISQSKS